MYKKLANSEICTVGINDDASILRDIFMRNQSETVFVLDDESSLYGIITIGDYMRNVTEAKDICRFMNKDFKRIAIGDSEEPEDAFIHSAVGRITSEIPNVRKIPVVNNNRIQYVLDCDWVDDPYKGVFFLNKKRVENLTSYNDDENKEVTNPLVRVIVPTYNNIGFVRRNLDGILMQKTDFQYEIYIFDDCSTDGTSVILQEYTERYRNVIADIQPKNLYSIDRKLRRKVMWPNIKGHKCKYSAYADGDDYWTDPYKLQIQVDFLENNSDFSICSGGLIVCNNFTGEQNLLHVESSESNIGFAYESPAVFMPYNFTKVIRTSAIPEYETVERFYYYGDNHVTYFALKNGKGYHFTRIFGVYNIHKGGVWSSSTYRERLEWDYKIHEELYRETRDELVREMFTKRIPGYAALCLETVDSRKAYYREIAEKFPELAEAVRRQQEGRKKL